MARDLYRRYFWILDTIKRYGSITREQLNDCWLRSSLSDGRPIPRRTFFNYREAIAETFGVDIVFNPATHEYSVEEPEGSADMTRWVLNSMAVTNLLTDSRDISELIFLENIPSARDYLNLAINALKEKQRLGFTYHSYYRNEPTRGVQLEPYFLKIFRQRWYVTGRNVNDKAVKTYALDRMTDVKLLAKTYEIPPTFDAEAYSRDSFGIIFNRSQPRQIVLRVNPGQAKYLRDLPLHPSQQERVTDGCSYFSYTMRLTYDLVQELMSLGTGVTVVEPPELRQMMIDNLRLTLANYENQ